VRIAAKAHIIPTQTSKPNLSIAGLALGCRYFKYCSKHEAL